MLQSKYGSGRLRRPLDTLSVYLGVFSQPGCRVLVFVLILHSVKHTLRFTPKANDTSPAVLLMLSIVYITVALFWCGCVLSKSGMQFQLELLAGTQHLPSPKTCRHNSALLPNRHNIVFCEDQRLHGAVFWYQSGLCIHYPPRCFTVSSELAWASTISPVLRHGCHRPLKYRHRKSPPFSALGVVVCQICCADAP